MTARRRKTRRMLSKTSFYENYFSSVFVDRRRFLQMIYQFVCKDITGASVAFSQFKGKVLLIVNTASACGLTPQYKDLEELYEKYKSQGFEVIAFPCNQFAHQESGSSEDILHFVREKYGITFPVMEKSDVRM